MRVWMLLGKWLPTLLAAAAVGLAILVPSGAMTAWRELHPAVEALVGGVEVGNRLPRIHDMLQRARRADASNPYVSLYLGLWAAFSGEQARARRHLFEYGRKAREGLATVFRTVFPAGEIMRFDRPFRVLEEGEDISGSAALHLVWTALYEGDIERARELLSRVGTGPSADFFRQRARGALAVLEGDDAEAVRALERAPAYRRGPLSEPHYGVGWLPFPWLLEEGDEGTLRRLPASWQGLVTTLREAVRVRTVEILHDLCILYQREGSYRRSIYIAELLQKSYAGEVSELGLGARLRRHAYPRSYSADVEKWSGQYGLDPFLVYSIVREETHFDPFRRSPAGAVGLMQLMPATARWIAKQMRLQGYHTGRLTAPEINIRLGCWLLKFLAERYPPDSPDGRAWLLAAYNGGQGNVEKWRARAEGKPALEVIPFPETRSYIERVSRTLEVYHELYGD